MGALDFKSFVAVCIAKKNQLLLKTFLQTFQVQFVFQSYSLATQRSIVRYLMGSDSLTQEKKKLFCFEVTLKMPYLLANLAELLENVLNEQEKEKYTTEAGPVVTELINKLINRIRREKEQYLGPKSKTVQFVSEADVIEEANQPEEETKVEEPTADQVEDEADEDFAMPQEKKKKNRKSRSRVFTDGTYIKPAESEISIKEGSIVD